MISNAVATLPQCFIGVVPQFFLTKYSALIKAIPRGHVCQ